jgi:PLP dependent protein
VTPASDVDVVAFAGRLQAVRERIAEAARRAGRSPADVGLIGVTKTHPPAVAATAVAAGLVDLGENRVQELLAKQPYVAGARWHLIGPLQRNKVRQVVGRSILLHTLDRPALADALSRRAAALGVVQRVLVQVNVGDDPAKAGCDLTETASLVAYARDLPNLAVGGLMTMPPMPPEGVDHNTAARPLFAALREERDRLRARFPEVVHLSMGMSADLDAAVAEGATMVRVGTALFGPRGERPWRPEDQR